MNLIIDGSNLLHRAFWINHKQGLIRGDMFIFLRTLKSYLNKYKPTKCFICWDKKLCFPSTNFRKQMQDAEYKANRNDSVNVYLHEDELSEMISCLGIHNMFPRVMEADDVMAWLCHNLDGDCLLISTDEDLNQLINEKVSIFHPRKKCKITVKNFEEIVGVPIDQYLVYKCIVGDPSDNIKGWFRYGPVKAKEVAKKLSEDPESIMGYSEEQQNIYSRNMILMNLSLGYQKAGPEEVEAYKNQLLNRPESNIAKFKEICENIGFKDFIKGMDEWENLQIKSEVLF